MPEEIKEILDYLKDEDEYYKKAEEVIVGYGDLIVEKEDIDKLLDYITNLQQENENLKNFIINLISTFNHCELNGTKKLDIVSDYIKQEYENILIGSDEK